MAVKIGHAKGDENGNAKGGESGDQTGKEILIQNWYNRDGGWDVVLVPTDDAIAAKAVANMIEICEDDSFGYDQGERWTGYNAINAAGGDISEAEDSEFDCSSVVDTAYILAGLNVSRGYTGNLERRYAAAGFVAHREPEYLSDPNYVKAGSLYLTAGKHVAMTVTDGAYVESASTEDYASEADQIDPPYVQIIGSVNVRKTASKDAKIIYTAKNEKLPFGEFDDDTGWYGVDSPKGPGFVSCNIPRWAKLVTK